MNFIKEIRAFDLIIVALIVIAAVMLILTRTGKRATSSNQIDTTVQIEFDVYLRGVATTSDEPLFQKDAQTFITIRNVPYTKLKIKDFQKEKRKVNLQNAIAEDASLPYSADYIVTLKDSAKITKEGDIVAGGNKIKIGLPITLEGAKYKLNGIISSVEALEQVND